MQRGTDIHKEVETYLKTGIVRDAFYDKLNYRPYVESMIPHLPPPKLESTLLEQGMSLVTPHGPKWKGYIDLATFHKEPFRVIDYKSTSNFRYAKTPEEVRHMIQPISYAKWVFEKLSDVDKLEIGLLYVKTEAKKVVKKPQTKLVTTVVDRAHVTEVWDKEMETVKEMIVASKALSADDLPPTVTSCGMYPPNGCEFLPRCSVGKDVFTRFDNLIPLRKKPEKETEDMSMAERLRVLKAEGTKTNGTSPTGRKEAEIPKISGFSGLKEKLRAKEAAKAKVPTGILPPDAPSRETEVVEYDDVNEVANEEAVAAKAAEPKKRGRPRKTEVVLTESVEIFQHPEDSKPKLVVHATTESSFEDWWSKRPSWFLR